MQELSLKRVSALANPIAFSPQGGEGKELFSVVLGAKSQALTRAVLERYFTSAAAVIFAVLWIFTFPSSLVSKFFQLFFFSLFYCLSFFCFHCISNCNCSQTVSFPAHFIRS